MLKVVPDSSINLEENLSRASDLLRCAAATAYESSDQLSGRKRDLAFSVMHLVEMAQALVQRSLEGVEAK
ncbi:DUF3077 domain-containing protein [Pseudomonas syringae]|nr:DUF3077 domain-containing protein [Pseudomonas syringae]